ncbi:MAG: transpeptidase family protein [Acidobacteria bacterium]|nr:transpeptidase family protein [Acidobacteriota bacterium]
MPERLNARTKNRPDNSRRRAYTVALTLVLWMFIISGRLVYLQVFQHEWLGERARRQQQAAAETNAPRGMILDRNGLELARSLEVDSFFAEPHDIEDPRDAARRFAPAAGADAVAVEAKLGEAKSKGRKFVWLAREVEHEQAEAVKALKLKGIHSIREPKRYYPNGPLAAHVLGHVGLDDEGLGGVERSFEKSLGGEGGRVTLTRDAKRHAFDSVEVAARTGGSVVLTIDRNIQHMAEQTLAAAVVRERAKSGTAVVLDPRTGEILALANAPTFDPNEAARIPARARVNQALQYVYEPGSTFKIVAYSAALEEGEAQADDSIDCQMGSITLLGRTVRDSHPYGTLTVAEALAKSSNVAAIKLGRKVGDERMYEYIRRFGFGERTGVELAGETRGLLRKVSSWEKTSIMSVAIGQEVGATPVQVAAAFGAVANDGLRVAPHIVKEVLGERGQVVQRTEPQTRQVVRAETARAVRRMLEGVTISGTAKAARLEGYTAAGKTGTAQKVDPQTRAYSKSKYVASFVGFAPVENPAVVIIVVLDEPSGSYYGGTVAAPVFREIAEQVLPYLDIAPDTELRPEARAAEDQIARADGADVQTESGRADQSPGGSPAVGSSTEDAPATLPEVVRGGGERGEVVYAPAAERSLLMPDVRGRSVRDAARVCAQLGLELEALGEGRAVRQSPAAGERVESGQRVRVEFGRSD